MDISSLAHAFCWYNNVLARLHVLENRYQELLVSRPLDDEVFTGSFLLLIGLAVRFICSRTLCRRVCPECYSESCQELVETCRQRELLSRTLCA